MGYDVNHLKDILQMDQATLKDYLELQLEDFRSVKYAEDI